jgi:hypothetical protein
MSIDRVAHPDHPFNAAHIAEHMSAHWAAARRGPTRGLPPVSDLPEKPSGNAPRGPTALEISIDIPAYAVAVAIPPSFAADVGRRLGTAFAITEAVGCLAGASDRDRGIAARATAPGRQDEYRDADRIRRIAALHLRVHGLRFLLGTLASIGNTLRDHPPELRALVFQLAAAFPCANRLHPAAHLFLDTWPDALEDLLADRTHLQALAHRGQRATDGLATYGADFALLRNAIARSLQMDDGERRAYSGPACPPDPVRWAHARSAAMTLVALQDRGLDALRNSGFADADLPAQPATEAPAGPVGS